MDMLTEIKGAEQKAAAQISEARQAAENAVSQVQEEAQKDAQARFENAKEQAAELLAQAMAQSLEETARTHKEADDAMKTLSAVAERNQAETVRQILSYL